MLRRSTRADFIAGAYVFPGGTVAAEDHGHSLRSQCGDDAVDKSLAYRICAIRECFEEAGVLLAHDAAGGMPDLDTEAVAGRFAALRQQVNAGQLSFAQLCLDQDLKPAIGQLILFSHWVTALGAPKRFDTRFFVAAAPGFQTPSHDELETIAHLWMRPVDALEYQRRGEIELVFPTIKTLESLSGFDSVSALIEHARQPQVIKPIQPRLATGRAGVRAIGPDDAAFAEVGKLDPDGKICASYEIQAGVPMRLSARVKRITAANTRCSPGITSCKVRRWSSIRLTATWRITWLLCGRSWRRTSPISHRRTDS